MASGIRTTESKQMTRGALIFAFNNEQTDYVAMAGWCARNIHRHLNIPVAVVTNSPDQARTYSSIDRVIQAVPESGGTRYFEDYQSTVTWHNAGRVDAYSLSPWERTLVLDADYVVASSQLNQLFETHQDFLCHRWAYDITGLNDFSGLNYFSRTNMPMWWATVMMFNKSTQAKTIFDIMNMAKHNWSHYRRLYGIAQSNYRNDHALSIALNVVSGNTLSYTGISWDLASLTTAHQLTQTDLDSYRVDFVNPAGRKQYITINNQDFHAMGKQQLGAVVANHS
jgi:hypothetical protein